MVRKFSRHLSSEFGKIFGFFDQFGVSHHPMGHIPFCKCYACCFEVMIASSCLTLFDLFSFPVHFTCSWFFYFYFLIFYLPKVEWWSTYGGGCPNLARLAVRILSQTCSSISYKQSQISFEHIHETRNCLEHQRFSDLFFVQCNLRLRQM